MNHVVIVLALGLSCGPVLAQTSAVPADAKAPALSPAKGSPGLSVASVRMENGIRAGKIIGSSVYGEGNAQLGTVEDLMMTADNHVIFAIVSIGGVIGIGGKLIAVPIGQVQHGPDGKLTISGMTKDSAAAMPNFTYG